MQNTTNLRNPGKKPLKKSGKKKPFIVFGEGRKLWGNDESVFQEK
jgi:hypothetical protein